MPFYEILLEIMNEKFLSIPDVARSTGLADSTIRSIISRKTKNVSLEVAFKMSKGLSVSLERLNGISKTDTKVDKEIKDDEIELLSKYSKLDEIDKNKAITYLDDLSCNIKYFPNKEDK